jgi:hypothetical protein
MIHEFSLVYSFPPTDVSTLIERLLPEGCVTAQISLKSASITLNFIRRADTQDEAIWAANEAVILVMPKASLTEMKFPAPLIFEDEG